MYNVTIFNSNVKGGLFWTIYKKYSKSNNWKKKTDYEFVIFSLIPEQGTDSSQDSWVLCSGLSMKTITIPESEIEQQNSIQSLSLVSEIC